MQDPQKFDEKKLWCIYMPGHIVELPKKWNEKYIGMIEK